MSRNNIIIRQSEYDTRILKSIDIKSSFRIEKKDLNHLRKRLKNSISSLTHALENFRNSASSNSHANYNRSKIFPSHEENNKVHLEGGNIYEGSYGAHSSQKVNDDLGVTKKNLTIKKWNGAQFLTGDDKKLVDLVEKEINEGELGGFIDDYKEHMKKASSNYQCKIKKEPLKPALENYLKKTEDRKVQDHIMWMVLNRIGSSTLNIRVKWFDNEYGSTTPRGPYNPRKNIDVTST